MKRRSFADAMVGIFRDRCYERERTTRDLSVRELRTRGPHRIHHRFPIKGGLNMAEAMIADDVEYGNPLLRHLMARKPGSPGPSGSNPR